MTSSGANTWSVPLEINNLESQITSATSGVQSITAGTNISLTGTGQNPIINSTGGVSSITAGTNITIGGTASVPIINATSTGVQSVTAGTNITIGGSSSVPIINATGVQSVSAGTGISVSGTSAITVGNTGVLSLTAGSGVVLTGTAQNPIVSASYSPPTTGTVFDFAGGAFLTIPVNQINECLIINSVLQIATPMVMAVPDYPALVAQFGANAVINFTIGNLQNGLTTTAMTSSTSVPPNQVRYSNNLDGASATLQTLQNHFSYSDPYTFPIACLAQMFRVSIVIDSVYQRATYCLTWLGQPS